MLDAVVVFLARPDVSVRPRDLSPAFLSLVSAAIDSVEVVRSELDRDIDADVVGIAYVLSFVKDTELVLLIRHDRRGLYVCCAIHGNKHPVSWVQPANNNIGAYFH